MRLVSLLLLFGCSAPSEDAGKRLHRRYWTFEDGTVQWDPSVFLDVRLGVECTPQLWSDGLTYCTPAVGPVAYTDADCTSAVGRMPPGDPTTIFMRKFLIEAEHRPSRMFRGDKSRALSQFWLFDGRACVGPFDGGADSFVDVEEVDAVRVREELAGDGRLSIRELVTDDGLRAPIALRDSLAESDCRPIVQVDGSLACIPTTTTAAPLFRDDTCSQRLVVISDGKPQPAVVSVEATSCPAYFHRGAGIVNFPAYYQLDGQCLPVELQPTELTFEVGAPFPLAGLEPRVESTSARLSTRHFVIGDETFPDARLYDSVLGMTCEPSELLGTARCIPFMPAAHTTYFSTTPSCDTTQPFLELESGPCDPSASYAIQGNSKHYAIHALPDPFAGPLYARPDGITCTQVNPGPVYADTTIVPVETFLAARRE